MRTIPKILLFFDLVWLTLWFIIMMWFESAYPALDTYRVHLRLIYRHIVNTLALVFVIYTKPTHILGILPFIFALLDDILNGINVTNRLTPVENQIAYNFTAALTWMALAVTILGTCWYVAYMVKKEEKERGAKNLNAVRLNF